MKIGSRIFRFLTCSYHQTDETMVLHHKQQMKMGRRILLLLVLSFLCSSQVVNAASLSKPQRAVRWNKKQHQSKTMGKHPPMPALILRGGGSGSGLDLSQQRGGAEIDKSSTFTLSEIRFQDIVYVLIHGGLMAAIVLFCRNVSRTGGRAPSWITSWVADPYATGVLHAAYFVLGFMLPLILPPGLSRVIFSPPSVALLGTVFPAVESVRAAVTDSGSDDRTWLMYWVIHGIFQYSTEFIDQVALRSEIVYKYWHTFEVLVVVWLLLPVTDGATMIYRSVAQPYLVPWLRPVKEFCDGWIATLALTTINAGYLWWFSFIFMSLPVLVKRYAVMGVGSIFPVASTIMALASTEDNSEMRWLTYWPCFSLVNLIMIGTEKFVGSFKGLYVLCLGAALYLMLPMFDGSMLVFRNILVPLLGQRELLLLRDAKSLAAQLFQYVPVERQEEARQTAARAFLD